MLFHSRAKSEEGRVLSNFYPCDIEYCGGKLRFKSAEAFFQGLKCLFSESPRDIYLFQTMEPLEAKKAGRKLKINVTDWNRRSVEAMTLVLESRYEQDERFRMLVNKYRQEGLYHYERGDRTKTFWGGDRNMLGKIMMSLGV